MEEYCTEIFEEDKYSEEYWEYLCSLVEEQDKE